MEKNIKKRVCWLAAVMSAGAGSVIWLLGLLEPSWLLAKEEGSREE